MCSLPRDALARQSNSNEGDFRKQQLSCKVSCVSQGQRLLFVFVWRITSTAFPAGVSLKVTLSGIIACIQ